MAPKPIRKSATANNTPNTPSETDTMTSIETDISTDTAFIAKPLDRAVKILVSVPKGTKKAKEIQDDKGATRYGLTKNLTMPGRMYYAPTMASIIAAVMDESAIVDEKQRPILAQLLELCDAELSRIASLGEVRGNDALYASLDDASKAVSLTYKYASPPETWSAWLAMSEGVSGTRTSDLAVRQAQDSLMDSWLASMYSTDADGAMVDKAGQPCKVPFFSQQAQGWLASVTQLRKLVGSKAVLTAESLADLLIAPNYTGIKPGQSARLVTWLKESNLALPTLDDIEDPTRAVIKACDVFSQATAIATATADTEAGMELDF